ncbi:unnamed protein product, partial [Ceratitis capitata]
RQIAQFRQPTTPTTAAIAMAQHLATPLSRCADKRDDGRRQRKQKPKHKNKNKSHILASWTHGILALAACVCISVEA